MRLQSTKDILGQFSKTKMNMKTIAVQVVEVAPTYNLVCNTGGKPRFELSKKGSKCKKELVSISSSLFYSL